MHFAGQEEISIGLCKVGVVCGRRVVVSFSEFAPREQLSVSKKLNNKVRLTAARAVAHGSTLLEMNEM